MGRFHPFQLASVEESVDTLLKLQQSPWMNDAGYKYSYGARSDRTNAVHR